MVKRSRKDVAVAAAVWLGSAAAVARLTSRNTSGDAKEVLFTKVALLPTAVGPSTALLSCQGALQAETQNVCLESLVSSKSGAASCE